jgi:hypothetical protein
MSDDDMIRALPAAQPRVKPLVWDDNGSADVYRVTFANGQGPKAFLVSRGAKIIGWHDDPDLAKAAVQADYEARILSALEPAAQPDAAQCCMCGKKGLSTEEDGGPECELSDGRWVCSSDCYDVALEIMLKPLEIILKPVAGAAPVTVQAQIDAAVKAERERCEKVAETCPFSTPWVAAAIRKGRADAS